MDNDKLRVQLVEAFKNRKVAPFRIPVDFSMEELQDADTLGKLEDLVIKKILTQLRPNVSGMDRSEIECLVGNIPDSFMEAIDFIEIEATMAEATMAPQNIVCLHMKKRWRKNHLNLQEQ